MKQPAARVLVTGAGGQLGSALLATAPAPIECRGVTHAECDIADPAAVRALCSRYRPDVLINAAAYTAVDRAESEPAEAGRVNAHAPREIAAALRATLPTARLLHVSTDFVFAGRSAVPLRTDDAPDPLSVYGQTKLQGERAVLETLGSQAAVVRTAWVYAPRGRNFVLTMLRLMRERGTVSVVCDQVGAPTAAHSLARALWALAERPALRGVLHWTDAGVASWYDFAVAIAEESVTLGILRPPPLVVPIRTAQYPTPARRPSWSVLDCADSAAALGLEREHWRVNLRRVLREIADAGGIGATRSGSHG